MVGTVGRAFEVSSSLMLLGVWEQYGVFLGTVIMFSVL